MEFMVKMLSSANSIFIFLSLNYALLTPLLTSIILSDKKFLHFDVVVSSVFPSCHIPCTQ